MRNSLSLAQPNGSVWGQSYLYDMGKRLTNITSGMGSFGYQYRSGVATLVSRISLPNAAFISNTCDSVSRLLSTSLSDGVRAFEYDDENQLIRVTVPNQWKSEFTHDGKMRRRIRKEFSWSSSSVWVQIDEVRYVYDGNRVIQERNYFNTPQITYTRGKDLSGSLEGAGGIGGLMARTDHSTLSPQTAFYHADGNGNITCLINGSQLPVAKYLYDPFGNTLSKSGPLADVNLYRFSSKEWHENSGLVYYLYRYYEPNLQRWVNRDPIGEYPDGPNLYAFVGNRPVNSIDRFELMLGSGTITLESRRLLTQEEIAAAKAAAEMAASMRKRSIRTLICVKEQPGS